MSDSTSPALFNCLTVICHSFRADFSDSIITGGIVYNDYCYCPACYHKATAAAARFHDYDALQFPYFLESFRDFVYRLRDA